MQNLAGEHTADKTILEELYIAGIPAVKVDHSKCEVPYNYIGQLNGWQFKRAWRYWIVTPIDENAPGMPLTFAIDLHGKLHPTDNQTILGDVIRAGGHGGGIHPSEYVSAPIYSAELDQKLLALGYKKEYSEFLKKEYIPISCGAMAELCNTGKLDVARYVNCYHIDTQIGLFEFAKFINGL